MGEMRKVQPGWVEVHEKSECQREFMDRLANYDDLWSVSDLRKWLNKLESGALHGLTPRVR